MTTPTPNTEMISRAEKIANLGFKDNSFKFVADCYKNNIDDSFLTNKKKLDRLD
jgi:ribosomal protein S17E